MVTNLIILLITACFLCFYVLIKKSSKSDPVSTIDLVLFILVIYVYLPASSLLADNAWEQFYSFRFHSGYVYLVACVGVLSVFFAYWLTGIILHSKSMPAHCHQDSNQLPQYDTFQHALTAILFLLFVLSVYLSWFYINLGDGLYELVHNILLKVIGDVVTGGFNEHRLETRHEAGGLLTVLLPYMMVFSSVYLVFLRKHSGRKLFEYLLGIFILLTFFMLLTLFFRGRILFYLLAMLFSYLIVTKFRNLKKIGIIALLAGLLLLVGMTLVRSTAISSIDDAGLYQIAIFPILRRFVTSVAQLGYVLDHYEWYGSLWGGTFLIDLAALAPGPDLDFNGMLYQQMGYGQHAGTTTITILGEFYVNFGFFGVVLGGMLLGSISRHIEIWWQNSNRGIYAGMKYVLMSVYLSKTILAGIGSVFLAAMIIGFLFILLSILKVLFLISKPRSPDLRHNPACKQY